MATQGTNYLSTDPMAGQPTSSAPFAGTAPGPGTPTPTTPSGAAQSVDGSFGNYSSNPDVQALQQALAQGLTGQQALDYVKARNPNTQLVFDPVRGNFDMGTGGSNGLQFDTNASGVWGIHPYDDGGLPQGGNMGSLGGLYQGGPFSMPSASEFQQSPGYQFARDQGLQAVERSAASHGTLLTGGTLKRLAQYGTGLADQDYNNYFNRAYQTNQGNFNNQFSLANLGATAARNG